MGKSLGLVGKGRGHVGILCEDLGLVGRVDEGLGEEAHFGSHEDGVEEGKCVSGTVLGCDEEC